MEKKIARQLLSIGAVFLRPEEPFTWASGIKSPIYCDNRLILSAPAARVIVEQAIADTVKERFPQAESLMGTSTAGRRDQLFPFQSGHTRGNGCRGWQDSSRMEGQDIEIQGQSLR